MSMIEDKIEFVDGDYENCRQENTPRQIKTRKASFGSIFDGFTRFRLGQLEKKLEKMKNDALTEGYSPANFEKKIEKKATDIAKLEEKIMVLSKENVPTDYVKRRAIKLKNSMAANLSYNTNMLYSIGIENKNEVFSLDEVSEELNINDGLGVNDREVQEEIAKGVAEMLDEQDAAKGTLSQDEVRAVVNESFEDLASKQTGEGEVLGADAVRSVVNDSFDELERELIEPGDSLDGADVRAAVNETFAEIENAQKPAGTAEVLEGAGVRAAVEEKFDELDKQVGAAATVSPVVTESPEQVDVSRVLSGEEIRDTVDKAFAEVDLKEAQQGIPEVVEPFTADTTNMSNNSNRGEIGQTIVPVSTTLDRAEIEAAINEVIDRIKLSKGAPIKFDRFNEDGSIRTNTSMTDGAIKESQVRLGFDENGNPVNKPAQEVKNLEPEADLSDVIKEYVYTPMTAEEIRESQIKLGFDENGNPVTKPVEDVAEELTEYTYTPMTNEEIRESQIKLGFDEHGNLVNPPTSNYDKVTTATVVEDERSPLYAGKSGSSRESIIVSPERTATVVEKGTYVQESSFIPTEVHVKSSVSAKIEDYSVLREKILQLQKQQALSEQKKASAQKEAEEAAAKAQQAKLDLEASQRSVSQSMEMLKAYSEALEEDCIRNERTAEVAENDARMNLNFVDVQMGKVAENDRLIEEIDSLIGPRAVPESIKVR